MAARREMGLLQIEMVSAETACVYPVFSGDDVGHTSRVVRLLAVALAPEDLGESTQDSGGGESSSNP